MQPIKEDDVEHVSIQGERVPALGFGTWQLDGEVCRRMVAHALACGYRHLDTAQVYGNEEEVGAAIAASEVDRGEIFLTTKVWRDELAPERVRPSTESSLRKLRTDRVDLLLIHWPSGDVPLEATLEALLGVRDAGLTRHIGVSNFPPSLLERAVELAPIFTNQVEYHPFLSQDRLLELARKHGHLLTAYSPVAHGEVVGHPLLTEIGEAHGKTPVQVALRWLLQQEPVAAIPRTSKPEHCEANLDVFDVALSDAEMEAIAGLDRGQRLIDPGFIDDWER